MMMEQAVDLESLVHQRVGTVIVGKYTLDRVIGIGGMAAVYAATHRNQAEFAVKMLHPDVSSREDIRSRFLREGYIANSVKHPGAVRVVDDDVAEDGAAFLVMELLDGATVEDLWFRGDRQVPLRAALAIAHQLLDVLAVAHAKNIVHRDIKPANLFVTRSGDLKVLDFGIARLRDATTNAITQMGAMLGTPAFMAPEQARGQSKEVDGQTDVWAVGATVFALLSGRLVHEADSATMLLLKVATTPARSLTRVVKDLPEPITALVDKALAFEKTSRWESAAAMRDALQEAYTATLHEPINRDVLAAYFREMEEAPVHSTPRPDPTGAAESTTPVPDSRSLVATKVEGRRPSAPDSAVAGPPPDATPPVATLPVETPSDATPPAEAPPATPPPAATPPLATAPVATASIPPPAPSPVASTAPSNSESISTVPPRGRPAAPLAHKRSVMPFVVGALIVLGVLLGIAAMLSGRAPTAP
jgi:eukaryotic-like serine/threonine-protein kinase